MTKIKRIRSGVKLEGLDKYSRELYTPITLMFGINVLNELRNLAKIGGQSTLQIIIGCIEKGIVVDHHIHRKSNEDLKLKQFCKELQKIVFYFNPNFPNGETAFRQCDSELERATVLGEQCYDGVMKSYRIPSQMFNYISGVSRDLNISRSMLTLDLISTGCYLWIAETHYDDFDGEKYQMIRDLNRLGVNRCERNGNGEWSMELVENRYHPADLDQLEILDSRKNLQKKSAGGTNSNTKKYNNTLHANEEVDT